MKIYNQKGKIFLGVGSKVAADQLSSDQISMGWGLPSHDIKGLCCP